jgi:hypothetical protein
MSILFWPLFWLLFASPLALLALHAYLEKRQGAPGDSAPAGLLLAAIIAAVALAAAGYRLLLGNGLGQTAALFVGIPALLAIATAFSPAKSTMGVALKSVTIGLLVSMIFLGEGMLCVLMSAPLFYAIAVLMAWSIGGLKNRDRKGLFPSFLPLLAIVPMSLEGVTAMTTLERSAIVTETRIVNAPAADIAQAIHNTPRFDRSLPAYLSIGFPRPTSVRQDDKGWVIRFRGGEMRLDGMEARAGDLVLERDGEAPGMISWKAVSDDSHMRHFLTWQSSKVEWTSIDAQTTRVTWTLRYHRDLDPAWYFGPMERYAVRLAAGYLIDTVATP